MQAPEVWQLAVRGRGEKRLPVATLAEALQLGVGENTWFGLGQHQGRFVLYRGAANKGRLVYPIALRVPALRILAEAHRRYLREMKIQRVVTRTTAAALLSQGNQLLSQKDQPGALALFNQAVAKDPASPEVYYFRGLCQKRMKNYPGARASLIKLYSKTKDAAASAALDDARAGPRHPSRADIPPSQWGDTLAVSTGGKGIIETNQDLSDLTNSLFK